MRIAIVFQPGVAPCWLHPASCEEEKKIKAPHNCVKVASTWFAGVALALGLGCLVF